MSIGKPEHTPEFVASSRRFFWVMVVVGCAGPFALWVSSVAGWW